METVHGGCSLEGLISKDASDWRFRIDHTDSQHCKSILPIAAGYFSFLNEFMLSNMSDPTEILYNLEIKLSFFPGIWQWLFVQSSCRILYLTLDLPTLCSVYYRTEQGLHCFHCWFLAGVSGSELVEHALKGAWRSRVHLLRMIYFLTFSQTPMVTTQILPRLLYRLQFALDFAENHRSRRHIISSSLFL